MSSEFINANVDKIMKDNSFPFPQNMAMASAWILGNLKGINLKVLDVQKTSSLADYFVIASATNSTQAAAMADEITVSLKRVGAKVFSKEGIQNSDWILLDLGDILVHIFQESARDVYAIEQLWKDAAFVKIPNEYYSSSEEGEILNQSSSDSKGRDFF